MKLLSECENPAKITARQIVAEAKTNLAMINYYFKSKEELMNVAIGRIIADSADNFKYVKKEGVTPKEHLRKILYKLCDTTILYKEFTMISVPYILLEDEITLPFDILPIIREHFKDKKSETECRVIAYEMISFMQLVFFRSKEFFKYSGIDAFNTEQRNNIINMQLNLLLGDEE